MEFPAGSRSYFLRDIGEPDDNVLRLVILEGGPAGPEQEVDGTDLKAIPVLPLPESRPLELVWDNYVVYAVRNESFVNAEHVRPVSQAMLTERTGTEFLAFVTRSTMAGDAYPGPLRHWELLCLNHVIDVAAVSAPAIRELD
jgi:hypothetical protein